MEVHLFPVCVSWPGRTGPPRSPGGGMPARKSHCRSHSCLWGNQCCRGISPNFILRPSASPVLAGHEATLSLRHVSVAASIFCWGLSLRAMQPERRPKPPAHSRQHHTQTSAGWEGKNETVVRDQVLWTRAKMANQPDEAAISCMRVDRHVMHLAL